MKRPLGLWILLSTGVLWLNTQDVHGIRATSLIFSKTSTTSTPSSTTSGEKSDSTEEEEETKEVHIESSTGNSSKPVLTGIPQIDYIWDPNLPKELNGYNLSDYPFYERVPPNITFKCDGLHDGFYASVIHKCQVYHHCLFGTRFDFLCANYTAFDQKTFICHFASEVDCNNSKRFWHRNDALYQAASTTTSKPLIIPTTPSPTPPLPVAAAAIPSSPGTGPRRGVGRPYRRRRPYYDYYDDYYDDFYYDDRPRSRGRKRPRPRPRPVYEEDYEDEYDEERYERRGSGGRRNENRRPYNRRPNKGRTKDRPRYDYDDEDDRFEDEEDVYHHCLFGIRYDFLCANFTAFDQTLFNCNFVNKVDCQNSKKYWSRNDELYKTQSTTPIPIVYSYYTPPPIAYNAQGSPIRRIPSRRFPIIANPAPVPVENPAEQAPPPAGQTAIAAPIDGPENLQPQQPTEVLLEPRRRTRPAMRVRPYYDYYDDYEDPPRYMRKRPRPRPYYDDDDYEYYDDRHYRRNEGRRRRPYEKPMRRYKGRRDKYEDDDEYEEEYAEDDETGRKKSNRGTASGNKFNSRRKPSRTPQYPAKPSRRPIDDEYEEYDDKVSTKRPRTEPTRSRNSNKRPNYEYEDDQSEETNYKKNKKGSSSETPIDESKTVIRPTTGSIFDRPRVASSKFNLPKNVYKAASTKTKEEITDDEEDEEEDISLSDKSQESPNSSSEIPDVASTARGNLKRSFMSRRSTTEGKLTNKSPNRKVQPSQPIEYEEVDEEIQEGRANMRQTSVKVKNSTPNNSMETAENPKKDVERSESQERLRPMSRGNMYQSRHSLSTHEAIDVEDPDDLTEIDDSINEA